MENLSFELHDLETIPLTLIVPKRICFRFLLSVPLRSIHLKNGQEDSSSDGAGRKVGIAAAIAMRLAIDGWDLVLTYWAPYEERMPWGTHASDPVKVKKQLESVGASVFLIESNLENRNLQPRYSELLRKGAAPFLRSSCPTVSV